MVELSFMFSVRGFVFQSGLDVLRKSAEAGLNALNEEIAALQRQLEDYCRVGQFEGERDEEGCALWERSDVLEYEIRFANDAKMELRKAFAITCFHHWERSVQRWIEQECKATEPNGRHLQKKPHAYGYEDLSRLAKNIGHPPSLGLRRLSKLVNTLKHNSEARGTELLGLWPDVFPREFQRRPDFSDWASSIALSEEYLDEIFNIAAESGPSVHNSKREQINT